MLAAHVGPIPSRQMPLSVRDLWEDHNFTAYFIFATCRMPLRIPRVKGRDLRLFCELNVKVGDHISILQSVCQICCPQKGVDCGASSPRQARCGDHDNVSSRLAQIARLPPSHPKGMYAFSLLYVLHGGLVEQVFQADLMERLSPSVHCIQMWTSPRDTSLLTRRYQLIDSSRHGLGRQRKHRGLVNSMAGGPIDCERAPPLPIGLTGLPMLRGSSKGLKSPCCLCHAARHARSMRVRAQWLE